jgi:phage tail sheath gpL-like
MGIVPSSLAAGNQVSVKNVQFAVEAQVVPQKTIIIGTYDEETFTDITPNVPIQVLSAADVGGKTGYGFMLHRLARAAFTPGNVETWIIPQAEGGSDPDQAEGEIDFSASAGVLAGTIALYIAADRVAVAVASGDLADDIGEAIQDAINDDEELPVTAVNAAGVVTLTSKSGGEWGNDISINFNLNAGEALPTGVSAVVTNMAGGTGIPDIQDALDALGTGDAQNEKNFTVLVHGYGQDSATLNAISVYNGEGNDFVGNYKKEIGRPFRAPTGDVTPLAAGLTAALAVAELRRDDRTNGIICVPGSPNHPSEIAAQAGGIMAVTNSTRAEESYIDKLLVGVYPGDSANRWTNDYDNRDLAVRNGVGTTFVKNGNVYLQNVITFYRPTTIAPSSNAYRSMRNISIIQNMIYNYKANFEREKWKGITIVEDVAAVSNPTSREKARDVNSVIDDLLVLADQFAANAWAYNSSFAKSELQKGDKVTLRPGLTGFDITFKNLISGEGGIFNSVIELDTSIAILSVGGA